MDQNIAHASDLPPWNFRVGCPKLSAQILSGFANHFKVADYTVLDQARGQEGFLPSFCVFGDAIQAISDAFEV